MALTLVGEGLNETLNPTLRVRRLLPVVLPPRRGDEGTEPTRGEAREGGTP
jgi:peptide/nickel transport system permease protein